MSTQTKINDLSDFLEEQLPIFDEILAAQQTPLPQRPLAAAIQFVSYCIVDIKDDDKEDFLRKPWFKVFYQLISKWYADRYADAMKIDRDDSSLGVVLIYDTPFKLKIPLSITESEEPGKKMWFCLPNEVLEQEKVLNWIVNAPNFNKVSTEELSSIESNVSAIATATRSIRINLMTATLKQKGLHKLSGGIPAHIDKSVRDILSLDEGRISNSFWEIHLAVEKSLKLLIRQRGCVPDNIHDLGKLCKYANKIDKVTINCNLIKKLPPHQEAIRLRYGEGGPIAVQQAVLNYKNALNILKIYTEALSREFTFKNARFLIQVPPWEQ